MDKKLLPIPCTIFGNRCCRSRAQLSGWACLLAVAALVLFSPGARAQVGHFSLSPVAAQSVTNAAEKHGRVAGYIRGGILAAAQDGTGAVWAYPAQLQRRLLRWQGRQWRWQPLPRQNAWVMGIGPGADRGIVVNWNLAGEHLLIWRRGNVSLTLGHLPAACDLRSTFVAGAATYAICAGQGGCCFQQPPKGDRSINIYRLNFVSPPQLAAKLSADDMYPFPLVSGRLPSFIRLHVTRAGDGSVWLWAGMPGWRPGAAQLRGFLILRHGKFTRYAKLPGLPNGRFSCVGAWDRRHLAVAMLGGGLYRLNLTSLRARPLLSPRPGALRFVQKIWRVRGAHYVIAATPGRISFENTAHRLKGILWRATNGPLGPQWQPILSGLDEAVPIRILHRRPELAGPRGIWLGSFGTGLWFLPRHAAPRLLNWRSGLPLATVNELFRLPSRHFLAIDNNTGHAYRFSDRLEAQAAKAPKLLPASASAVIASPIQVLNPIRALEPDRRGHVWGMLAAHDRSLAEWTGRRWLQHPLPPAVSARWISSLDLDRQGRVWLFPDCRLGPMAIYHPRTGKWQSFGGYRTALQTVPGRVRMLHPRDDRARPIYGPRHQIAFIGLCLGINYFDGSTWHLWNRQDLPGDGLPFGGPFFDAAGHLAVDLRTVRRQTPNSRIVAAQASTWEWRPNVGWMRIAYQKPSPVGSPVIRPSPLLPPPSGCQTPIPVSLVHDQFGRAWWTTVSGSVYVGFPGHCRRLFSAAQRQPFIDGRKLVRVFMDARGRAFLETLGAGVGEYVILSPRTRLPRGRLRLASIGKDGMRARFSSNTSPALFSWRLDHGPWSPPSRRASVDFSMLPGGTHRLQLEAFDARLRAAPRPATAVIEIKAKPQRQIARLLARLAQAKNDRKRQAIIAALLLEPPALVVPALRAALPAAPAAEQWWLKAALQQAEAKINAAGDRQ